MIRHVTPVRPEDATGPVAAVYDQANTEPGSIGPAVMMLSPAPELLVPAWALLHESPATSGEQPGSELALRFVNQLALALLDRELETSISHATQQELGQADPGYVALRTAALRGQGLLSEPARAVVHDTITRHRGPFEDHDRLAEVLAPLAPADRPGAARAILAGLAPREITDEDVASWRGDTYTDHCLLHLLAYGAITAVEASY
jgi:hypothetical protein